MEHRLAAVLAADMVGYSRLMEADEQGAVARLRTHRIQLIEPAIAKNHGRIIKTTGDGMLVEFTTSQLYDLEIPWCSRLSRSAPKYPSNRSVLPA